MPTEKMKNDIPSFFLEFQAQGIKLFHPRAFSAEVTTSLGRNTPKTIQVFKE